MAAPSRIVSMVYAKQFARTTTKIHQSKISNHVRFRSTTAAVKENTSSGGHGSLAAQFIRASEDAPKTTHAIRTICRTNEKNPSKHTDNHVGLFYTIDEAEKSRFLHKTFHVEYYKMAKSFCESTLMVRKPAVEIINYMQQANYDLPAIRYILYGKQGCGKTCTLGHVMHYCGKEGWLIVHVPWASHFNRYGREIQMSTYKKGRVDQPLEAAELLAYLRQMNLPLLQTIDLKCSRKYVWSKREIAEEGSSIMESIDFALQRVKYATDVLGMVLREIRSQASSKGYKVLVAVDGANAFWSNTIYKNEEDRQKKHMAEDLSLVHQFKKMVKNDWSGGASLCTIDSMANTNDLRESHLPRYLLGKEGFEHFDPHIPIHVDNYNDKEVQSCLEYFIDRKWITNSHGLTDAGKKELIFLSNKNPQELYNVTSRW